MRAVIIDPAGGPEYQIAEMPDLAPSAGDALLEMHAATLNFRDMIIRGNPVSPYCGDARGRVAGSDGVGTVRSIGPNVTGVDIGGRYMPAFFPDWLSGPPEPALVARHLGGSVAGVLSENCVSSARSLVAVPDHLSDEEAAALPCAGVTAWACLIMYGQARSGQTVLIQGTGGVSIFALQIAKLLGLRVIVMSSSDTKLEHAQELGADILINYSHTPDWAEAVLDATGGRGVDHLIDIGGEGTTANSLRVMAMGGHLSLAGVIGGFGGTIDAMLLRSRTMHLHTVFVESRQALEQLARFASAHGMKPVIDSVFPLAQTNEANSYMASGKHFGKVAVRIRQ